MIRRPPHLRLHLRRPEQSDYEARQEKNAAYQDALHLVGQGTRLPAEGLPCPSDRDPATLDAIDAPARRTESARLPILGLIALSSRGTATSRYDASTTYFTTRCLAPHPSTQDGTISVLTICQNFLIVP